MEVDNRSENSQGCEQVHDVGEMLSVEGLAEGTSLVGPSDQKVEKSDDCSLELLSTASIDGGGREGLPDDGFADVCGDEERDARSQTIALLEQFIEQNHHQARNDQLDNQKEADTSAEVAWLAVETGENENAGLAEREDNSEQLLRRLVQFTVGLEIQVDVNEVSAREKLELCEHRVIQKDMARPRHTWKTIPEEMIGVVPNSISVPLLLANIIRSQ